MTTPRETAQVLLATPNGDPVLAAWQHGLGRAMAWTSDFTGRWGTQWVGWEEFPRLAAQLVSWLLPTPVAEGLTVQAVVTGGELVLSAQAQSPEGEALSGLQVSASLVTGEGAGAMVPMREVTPGEYRATVRDRPAGAYLVQVVAQDAAGLPVGAVTAGAVVPMSAEYRTQTADPALLEALARETGGRIEPPPAEAFARNAGSRGAVAEIGLPLLWLALALLPLDIALRRLMLGRDQVAAGVRRVGLGRLAARIDRPIITTQVPSVNTASDQPSAPLDQKELGATRWSVLGDTRSTREAELERLREAQEQARRRIRGEE
jgi:hypothetical protein